MVVRLDKVVSCNKTGGPWVKTFENPLDLLMPICFQSLRGYIKPNKIHLKKEMLQRLNWFLDGIQTTYFRSVIIKLSLFTRNTSISLLLIGGLGFERKVHDKTVKQLR